MNPYDKEQLEILNSINEIRKSPEFIGTSIGNKSAKIIKKCLEKHLDRNSVTVTDPNKKIKGIKNKIADLIIIKSGIEPVELNTYHPHDILHVIEVKTSRLQEKGFKRFKELRESALKLNPEIKFSFIRVFGCNFDKWKDNFSEGEYFLLSEAGLINKGEWEKFLEHVKLHKPV